MAASRSAGKRASGRTQPASRKRRSAKSVRLTDVDRAIDRAEEAAIAASGSRGPAQGSRGPRPHDQHVGSDGVLRPGLAPKGAMLDLQLDRLERIVRNIASIQALDNIASRVAQENDPPYTSFPIGGIPEHRARIETTKAATDGCDRPTRSLELVKERLGRLIDFGTGISSQAKATADRLVGCQPEPAGNKAEGPNSYSEVAEIYRLLDVLEGLQRETLEHLDRIGTL